MRHDLTSFTAPFTACGRAALVPPPPWHYAGWLINVAITCDTANSQSMVPAGLGRLTGNGCIHFADWQATTDGREMVDPVYAQYRETIVIVEIKRPDGTLANFCPFIWVDQDISLMRGLLQGWPKKFGSTYLTRSMPIEHLAAAPLRAATKLGASLCVKDRRLIEASLELTGNPGRRLGFLANKTVGLVGWPDLTKPDDLPPVRWLLPDIQDKVTSSWHEAMAEIRVLDHPVEELSLLGVVRAQTASVGWIGISIVGAQELSN